mmetsp:Transcript_100151/g.323030  ORF Transcript_100151/g.323030 Transcript_100151/m.323030 type:complete len:388 (+) Transcript_100151:683-1846(+)
MAADVRVGARGIPAHAAPAAAAVDEDLGCQVHLRPRTAARDGDPVGERRRHALRPAAAAILWDVLVLVPSGVVHAGDVPPVPGTGDVTGAQRLMWPLAHDQLAADGCPVVLRATAARPGRCRLPLRLHGGWLLPAGLGAHGSLDVEAAATAVLRHGPLAVRLDAQGVLATADAEPAVVPPVGAPAVTPDPVVLAPLRTVTDDGDGVVRLLLAAAGALHDAEVGQLLEDRVLAADGARDGPPLQLSHHGLGAIDQAELLHTVLRVLLHRGAALPGTAVHADILGAAGASRVMALGLVELAGLLGQAVLVDEAVGRQRIAPTAAVVVLVAVQHDLHGQVDLARTRALGDADAVGERCGRCEGPAGTTVLGDVLVARGGGVGVATEVPPI